MGEAIFLLIGCRSQYAALSRAASSGRGARAAKRPRVKLHRLRNRCTHFVETFDGGRAMRAGPVLSGSSTSFDKCACTSATVGAFPLVLFSVSTHCANATSRWNRSAALNFRAPTDLSFFACVLIRLTVAAKYRCCSSSTVRLLFSFLSVATPNTPSTASCQTLSIRTR